MTTTETDFRVHAPQPTAPRPYHFPNVIRETLENGLRVLVAENHSAPLVSVRALIRSGADHDAGTPGLAAFTADLLDEGAGSRDGVQLAEDLGLLGGGIGSGSDWDAAYISLDVLSRNFNPSLDIFADVVQRPSFPADAIERVRTERLTEILQQRDEASAIASKRFSGFLYRDTAYGNAIIGTAGSVGTIAQEQARTFYESNYLPDNASLIVAGDVEAAPVLRAIRKSFDGWRSGRAPEGPSIAPHRLESSRVYLIDRAQAVQSEIRIGHVGVPRSCEDYFPLFIMNALLGGVFNSRINLNLRERRGYTYGARSSFSFRRHAGPFVVGAPVRNEVTKEAIEEVLNELRQIRTGDITDVELDDTKNYIIGVFPATLQSSSDIAGRLIDMELHDLPRDHFDRYRDRVAAVTKDDIARVAQKYIDPDRLIIVVVGSAEQIREPLGTLGLPISECDIDGKPIE